MQHLHQKPQTLEGKRKKKNKPILIKSNNMSINKKHKPVLPTAEKGVFQFLLRECRRWEAFNPGNHQVDQEGRHSSRGNRASRHELRCIHRTFIDQEALLIYLDTEGARPGLV